MKNAFTMIELTFIIVVIGILVAVILPRVKANKNAETAVKMLSNIRYTQHLALIDDKFKEGKNWEIKINTVKKEYSILNNGVYAKSIISKKKIKNISIKVDKIILSGGCANEDGISFDHIGRPYSRTLMKENCIITLKNGDERDEILTIFKETGYAERSQF